MANVLVQESSLESIANAIRYKNGTPNRYKPDEMAAAIRALRGGGIIPSGELEIIENGTYNVRSYETAEVNVPQSGITPTGTKQIIVNGTHDVTEYASAEVAVPNTYSAGDEGKVVSSGALVSQTAHADVTPTTSDQTIDTTANNSIKVKGDADLVATNIKKDVEIFGVTGSYEGGGSASPFTLLDTIIISEDTRAISVDVSEYSDNEIIFLEADFELTQADYLYIVKNGDSPTGGSYSTSQKVFKGIICAAGHWVSASANTKLSSISSNTTLQTTSGFPTNYYFYTYTATKLIKAGGKINIYGYNL